MNFPLGLGMSRQLSYWHQHLAASLPHVVLLAIATLPAAQVMMISEVNIFKQANNQLLSMCKMPEVIIMLDAKGDIEKE